MSVVEDQTGLDIEVYGRSEPYCAACDNTKRYLDAKFINYFYRDIAIDERALEFLLEQGISTVPAIFYGKTYIGGFDNLKALIEAREDSRR